jgi:hypothetical protein
MPRLGSWLEKGWRVPILVPRQQNLHFLTLLISRNEQVSGSSPLVGSLILWSLEGKTVDAQAGVSCFSCSSTVVHRIELDFPTRRRISSADIHSCLGEFVELV